MGPILGATSAWRKRIFRFRDDRHNYDCRDTTRDTTSLLLMLQPWRLLKSHSVGDPKNGGNALVLRTPHNTAA